MDSTATVTTHPKCFHANGVFFRVEWWLVFHKEFYWCEDCHRVIDAKIMRKKLQCEG